MEWTTVAIFALILGFGLAKYAMDLQHKNKGGGKGGKQTQQKTGLFNLQGKF